VEGVIKVPAFEYVTFSVSEAIKIFGVPAKAEYLANAIIEYGDQ